MARSNSRRGRTPAKVVGLRDLPHLFTASDPDVAELIEQANVSGDADGLAEQLGALMSRRLPSGVRVATDDEIEGPPREFRRFIRAAAKPLARRGWRTARTRFTFDAPSGHWADIKLDVGPGPAPLPIEIFAVVGSPYIDRVYNGGAGIRPRSWGRGHVKLLWQARIAYDPSSTGQPKRLHIPHLSHDETGVVLGRVNAQPWLTDMLGRLAAIMQELCSDRAMRDWLAEHGRSVNPLRYAVLLSHHLGDLGSHRSLVERTRIASEAHTDIPTNDRGRDALYWSHNRFMAFVDSLDE